jgi:hypothetical protein
MDTTAAIAIYAALVATAALLVQYIQWRSSRTRVKVETHAGVAPILSEEKDSYGNELQERDEVLFIQLTNRSPHAVKITHVGAVSVDKKEKKGLAFTRPYPLNFGLPIEISARDNVTLWQPRKGLAGWEGKRMQAVIRTAAGDDFESPKFRLDDLSRLEIVG